MVDYVTEVNPLRVGKYLPGVHIPIVDEGYTFEDSRQAGAGILFAWNYSTTKLCRSSETGGLEEKSSYHGRGAVR